MTAWEEFKQIWSTDGWGQPRTAASKVALIFYTIGVAVFAIGVIIWLNIQDLAEKIRLK